MKQKTLKKLLKRVENLEKHLKWIEEENKGIAFIICAEREIEIILKRIKQSIK